MYFIFIILLLIVGLLFIVSALNIALPVSNNMYSGVISNIDENSNVYTVEYDKKGEKRQATFCIGSFQDSMFNVSFSGRIGTKVNFTVDNDNKIQTLVIPKEKNEKQEKRKISWGVLIIGLFMFGYGLYNSVLIILTMFA